LPQGADLKNAGVIYDRDHSAFSQINQGNLIGRRILDDVSWFHFSAINPALNENIAALYVKKHYKSPHKKYNISVDLNYRSKFGSGETA
jgi:2-dehydro-3-deoxygluconokinase